MKVILLKSPQKPSIFNKTSEGLGRNYPIIAIEKQHLLTLVPPSSKAVGQQGGPSYIM